MLTIPEQNLFGLDISQSKLRLVQIQTKRQKKTITALREVALPSGVIREGEIADPKLLTQLIGAIYRGKELRDRIAGNGVISVLPETKTFIKLMRLGTDDPDRVNDALREEIPRQIPLPMEEIYYDWQLIGDPVPAKPLGDAGNPTAMATNGTEHLVLVGAAPRHLVDAYLGVLRQAGLLPFALEIEAAAITRCLLDPADRAAANARIIIDMGAERTGLIIVKHGTIQFTVSLPISGDRVTQTIAETLKINGTEAEEAKLVCGLDNDRCQGALRKVLYAMLDDLGQKIDDAIAFYQENFSDEGPISDVVLTGGGANFLNIDRVLADRIKLPVKLGNPLTNVRLLQPVPTSLLHSYATAIGLALRGTQKDAVI